MCQPQRAISLSTLLLLTAAKFRSLPKHKCLPLFRMTKIRQKNWVGFTKITKKYFKKKQVSGRNRCTNVSTSKSNFALYSAPAYSCQIPVSTKAQMPTLISNDKNPSKKLGRFCKNNQK